MRITEVLRRKGEAVVVTISPDQTVRELVALLGEHRIGALVVSGDGGQIDGIVSERDVVRRLNEDPNVLDVTVSAIMTAEVHTCLPDDSVEALMAAMTELRIRHVPVVVDGRLTGIVSIGDMVKHRLTELEAERDQLTAYING